MGADAEAVEGAAYWLAPHGLFGQLSYRTQDHQPGDGATHCGLNLPTSIINQENAQQACLQPSLMRQCFLVGAPSSQMTLAWIKLT